MSYQAFQKKQHGKLVRSEGSVELSLLLAAALRCTSKLRLQSLSALSTAHIIIWQTMPLLSVQALKCWSKGHCLYCEGNCRGHPQIPTVTVQSVYIPARYSSEETNCNQTSCGTLPLRMQTLHKNYISNPNLHLVQVKNRSVKLHIKNSTVDDAVPHLT